MNILLIPFLLGLSANVFAQISYVPPAKLLSKKAYQIGVYGDYFSSSKRVDKKGKKVPYLEGESFSRIQGEFAGYYGLTDDFQIGAGVRSRQNQFKIFNSTTNQAESETSTGVQSTFISLMYGFKPVDRLQYSLEGLYRFTPYTNEESTLAKPGSLILGDQGPEYSAGLVVTYSFLSNNFFTARGGYRRPGKDLSSELYWQLEAALVWKHVALIAGVDGVTSMNNDAYENDLTNRPVYNTGTTALYNNINREWIAPYAGVNVALGQTWRAELKGSQVVSGRSTDFGTAFGVSLIRRVGDKTNKEDKKFKEYDFETSVTKISPKKGFVVIDKGMAEDIRKGMKIDFYEFDYVGGNLLLAQGIVIEAKATSSIVKITHVYNTKKQFKEGTLGRGSFR
jgi:hypothetical protein